MSKSKNYMVKAEAIARDVLAKIQKANADLSAAEQCRKENRAPRTGMVDAEVMAKAARAEADYVEAKAAYEKCRRELPATTLSSLSAIRRDLSVALGDEYSADPSAIDAHTLELLKCGILRSDEYVRLMNRARAEGNDTMARIIGKYAATAVEDMENRYGPADQRVMELRAIALQGDSSADAMGEKLGAFDALVEAFQTSAGNTAMIPDWESLTGPIIEAF